MGKRFHLGDVLTVTTDILLSPRLIDGVYDILNYMTGESLFTHQLPRAGKICKPYLLKQFPQLKDADVSGINPENYQTRLDSLVAQFGEWFEVEPLPKGAYTYIDPITEAEAMVGPEKVIVVKTD
jgi:hypothetical protein